MDLDFLAEFAIFLECQLAFAFYVHVDLITRCRVILILADCAD